jgi:hypothetical protein
MVVVVVELVVVLVLVVVLELVVVLVLVVLVDVLVVVLVVLVDVLVVVLVDVVVGVTEDGWSMKVLCVSVGVSCIRSAARRAAVAWRTPGFTLIRHVTLPTDCITPSGLIVTPVARVLQHALCTAALLSGQSESAGNPSAPGQQPLTVVSVIWHVPAVTLNTVPVQVTVSPLTADDLSGIQVELAPLPWQPGGFTWARAS